MTSPRRVVVVGGGIAGLAAAWRLQQHFQKSQTPLQLSLLEASGRTGGFLKSTRRDGFLLEMGPDCFISEKPRGIGLCRELGLEAELIPTRPDQRRSFIVRGGIFHPVPEGFYLIGPTRARPFLQSGLLSWRGKVRALLEPLIPGRSQTDESLSSFVRRRFGQELLDWMAQPLVAGIYGAHPEQLSLRATFPQFLEMERTFGSVLLGLKKSFRNDVNAASGARYSMFLTLKSGMQTLTDTLAQKLGPSVIQTGSSVKAIRSVNGQWEVLTEHGPSVIADAVCLALPSYQCAKLLSDLDLDMSMDLAGIAYAPAATLNFSFRLTDITRPLDGVGFVVPQKENRLVLGCTMAQNKFDGRAPEGFALLRAFLGGEHTASWSGESDETLITRVLSELRAWLGITASPGFTQVERYPLALPQYVTGHLERVVRLEERLFRHKGLALAGHWQYGVGIPDCIESGERAAGLILKHLA